MATFLGEIAYLLLHLSFIACQITDGPIVDTAYGQVQGRIIPLDQTGGSVVSFWSIPYAAPPVGDLRFESPVPHDEWSGVFQAYSPGPACPQGRSLISLTHPFWTQFDEDCLHVNVATPDVTGNYPVMVWFHGGGYTGSANFQYPGHFLASHGLVVVVVNYRLGNLGFLTTENPVVPGNAGMFDQVFALEWVQANIANFGGNPNMVTIFGQSAGASSSGLHMVSPKSTGLFHRAILESGTDFSMWSVNWPLQNPAFYTRQVADKLGCPTINTNDMVTCLKQQPWEILWNTTFNCTEGHFCQGMAPIIDGPGGFLPDYPIAIRESGQYNKVPTLNGHCREDGSLYTLFLIPESSEGGFTRAEFERLLKTNLLDFWNPQFSPETQQLLFDTINWYYSPWPNVDDEEANRQAFNFMITDLAFAAPADSLSKFQSLDNPVYFYVFGFRSTNASSFIPEWMGVPHNGEIPYVFGYPYIQLNPAVRNDTRILDIIDWNQLDIEYTDYFMPMIANFAKTGNPTPTPVVPPGGSDPVTWEMYVGYNRTDMHLNYHYVGNDVTEMRSDYRQRDFAIITEMMPSITGKKMAPEGIPIPPTDPVASSSAVMKKNTEAKREPKASQLQSDWFDKAMEKYVEVIVQEAYESVEWNQQ